MKTFILVSSLLLLAMTSRPLQGATAYPIEWTRTFSSNTYDTPGDVLVDSNDDIVIVGHTMSLLGTTHYGQNDPFLVKYDASGNQQWVQQFGSSGHDYGMAGAVDASGNIYVGGHTFGTMEAANQGQTDHYLARYDSAGNFQWVRQSGSSTYDTGCGVATDTAGYAYLAGETEGLIGSTHYGSGDAIVYRYSSSGVQDWVKQFGTTGRDRAESITADSSNNLYVTGWTDGTLGSASYGTYDAFLSRMDTSGNVIWTQQLGTSGQDFAYDVAVDNASGDIYVGGKTAGALDGANQGGFDAFLAKYSSSGALIWVHQLGTSTDDDISRLVVDAAGNIGVVGTTSGLIGDTNYGYRDAFVTMYDSAGALLWSAQWGHSDYDYGKGVACDSIGNLYVGVFSYIGGGEEEEGGGSYDTFLLKMAVPEPTSMMLLGVGALMLARRRGR